MRKRRRSESSEKVGIYSKKKQKIYRERDESQRKIFADKINGIPEDQLVFLDESGIDTFLYREYGRAKRGEKIMAEVAGKKFERQSIVAAQCGKNILAPLGYHGTCDAKLFNFWLEKMLVPDLKPGQTVIMDNASIHKTNTTRSIIEQAGCKLLFLPPYSPDLNPIEHLWANTKRKLSTILPDFPSIQDALCACFS